MAFCLFKQLCVYCISFPIDFRTLAFVTSRPGCRIVERGTGKLKGGALQKRNKEKQVFRLFGTI